MMLFTTLRKIRKEPFPPLIGDPMSIPCIETSDAEKICRNPVVSVCMITYNHEPYIRQAIEGVLSQKTDFAYELILGEDCSTDKTREICLAYQRKHPDRIRVLWAEVNVRKLGGNLYRCIARSRGAFVALCEGDDYWIDPCKLQKQVQAFREHPEISMCCHGYSVLTKGGLQRLDPEVVRALNDKRGDGRGFLFSLEEYFSPCAFSATATYVFRRCIFESVLFYRMPYHCDWIWCYLALRDAPGYYLCERMSVYRYFGQGVWSSLSSLDRFLWSYRRAYAVWKTDPNSFTRSRERYCASLLHPYCSPYKEMAKVRTLVGRVLRRFRGRSFDGK